MVKPLLRLKNVKESHYSSLVRLIHSTIMPNDCIALHGGLGAGKTTFARLFIRNYIGNDKAEVPSPTFTLLQHYTPKDQSKPDIYHYDFYRLENEEEVLELGFDDNIENSISLVEWPERITSHLPEDTLCIQFNAGDDENSRMLNFIATEKWQPLMDNIAKDKIFSPLLVDE